MASPETISGQITVEPLRAYSHQDAADLGILMHRLDPSFSSDPVPEDRMRRMISSPYHEQIVARRSGEIPRIVGAITVMHLMEPGIEYGYLGGVVVATEARGLGIAPRMLEAGEAWCRTRGLEVIEFVTEAHRASALRLYEKGWRAVRITDGENVTKGIVYNKHVEPAEWQS